MSLEFNSSQRRDPEQPFGQDTLEVNDSGSVEARVNEERRPLPDYEIANDPEAYIPLLDENLNRYLESLPEKGRRKFIRVFSNVYHEIAFFMVRYAVDEEIGSYSVDGQVKIVNPDTKRYYTFEELGFDRKQLVGSTAGSFLLTEPERVRHIPLVALALYRVDNLKDAETHK